MDNQRCKEVLSQKEKVENRIKQLTELKNKWNTIDSVLKYTGYIIFLITGAVATLCSALVAAGVKVPLLLILKTASVGILHSSLTKVLSKTITSSKKKKYKKQINHLNSCLDKMYLFFEKAETNQLISDEEIEECLKLKNSVSGVTTV